MPRYVVLTSSPRRVLGSLDAPMRSRARTVALADWLRAHGEPDAGVQLVAWSKAHAADRRAAAEADAVARFETT